MQLLPIIENLERKSNAERAEVVLQYLSKLDAHYTTQTYATGENIFTLPALRSKKIIAIASHFDVVPHSAGANDNGSAIAVCIGVLERLKTHSFRNFEVQVFFFDEEELMLRGSRAYVREFGLGNIMGLINLELVGQGTNLVLWSLTETSKGIILETLEQLAAQQQIRTQRLDKIIAHSADHVSFSNAGLTDCFTITCASDKDLETAYHYYKALEFEVDNATLLDIMHQAPIFKHYHQPSDLSIHLSEASLQLVLNTIWDTLLQVDAIL